MAKQRWKQRITTVRTGEGPTKERRNQNGGVVPEFVGRDANNRFLIKRYRAVSQSPLDIYREKKIISDREHKAGLQFRQVYFASVLSRRALEERLNRHTTTLGLTMSERTLRQAYRTLSPSDAGVIIDVCGHDLPVINTRRFEALKKGLGHLAVHWHMMAIEVCETDRHN